MKNRRLIQLLAPMFIMTMLYVGVSQLGVFLYERITSVSFIQNAEAASVDLSGKTKKQAMKLLETKVESWKGEQEIMLSFDGRDVLLDSGTIAFHFKESISALKEQGNSPLAVSVDEAALNGYIEERFPGYHLDQFPGLQKKIEDATSMLNVDETIDLDDFYEGEENVFYAGELDEIEVSPGLAALIQGNPVIDIPANARFSFLEFLDASGSSVSSPDDLGPVVSLLYELILHTDLAVAERNISTELPPYATLGLEARVNPVTGQDLVFMNARDTAYTVTFSLHDNTLKGQISGMAMPYEYKVRMTGKKEYPPRVVKQFSAFIPQGVLATTQEGKKGQLISVYRDKHSSEGEVIDEERISEDFYAPANRVEIWPLNAGEADVTLSDENSEEAGEDASGESDGESSTEGIREDSPEIEGETAPAVDEEGTTDGKQEDDGNKRVTTDKKDSPDVKTVQKKKEAEK
ncbi:VanW family protein [Rossellomorea marisflavi]|uniref:VanW family protein n=1 Tax=Rossellomorea marisflavi TaxID=189381 RepID=UPI00203C3ABB|nr:VanW family protein [Rossellomorea marisflavi]MCM2606012.1 VanW family protein [Rossellomorea marisflavi]